MHSIFVASLSLSSMLVANCNYSVVIGHCHLWHVMFWQAANSASSGQEHLMSVDLAHVTATQQYWPIVIFVRQRPSLFFAAGQCTLQCCR